MTEEELLAEINKLKAQLKAERDKAKALKAARQQQFPIKLMEDYMDMDHVLFHFKKDDLLTDINKDDFFIYPEFRNLGAVVRVVMYRPCKVQVPKDMSAKDYKKFQSNFRKVLNTLREIRNDCKEMRGENEDELQSE